MLNGFGEKFAKIKDKELLNLIALRTGGETTMLIIDTILKKPQNANQLAKTLNLHYTTVTYHIDIICKHNYFVREKFGAYFSYFPSDKLIKNINEYIFIKECINKKDNDNNEK